MYSFVHITDFGIAELIFFSCKWHLNKFKVSCVRYEIGISHLDRNVVWLHGPFPCRLWPDIKIYKEKWSDLLMDNEKVVADKG